MQSSLRAMGHSNRRSLFQRRYPRGRGTGQMRRVGICCGFAWGRSGEERVQECSWLVALELQFAHHGLHGAGAGVDDAGIDVVAGVAARPFLRGFEAVERCAVVE